MDVQVKLPLLATWLGHVSILSTYHYLHFVDDLRLAADRRFIDSYGGWWFRWKRAGRACEAGKAEPPGACFRDYFGDHLPRLRGMSPHTIHSYRDSLVLLLRFVASNRKIEVCDLDVDDLEPDGVLAFLAYLEKDRDNSVTTRNVRLAAIHAFFRYVGAHHPDHMERAQRVLGVPFKRADQRVIEYLDRSRSKRFCRVNRSTRMGAGITRC